MPTPRHRALRQRSIILTVLLVVLGSLVLTLAEPALPPASAATQVPKSTCKRYDPNLVNGVCLKYVGKSGTGYTWIGSYRATNGKIFFCIDFLYDSRIFGSAAVVDTDRLQNQFGARIGDAEVAALNYLISRWAPNGSTGTNTYDAAIALIIREVMSDAIRPDGTVVYRPGLKVGGTVAAPIGGLSGGVVEVARMMWRTASRNRGPSRLVLASGSTRKLELGHSRRYWVALRSAGHHLVPGVKVTLTCWGPIRCPRSVTTGTSWVKVKVTPRALGKATITARVSTPSGDGKLLRLPTWRPHGGRTARDNGVQRGWIARRNTTAAQAALRAEVVKGAPTVTTRTSAATVVPGSKLTDLVTVTGLPAGSTQQVTASLYGPLPSQPGADSCTEQVKVGQVTFTVEKDGTVRTPPITVDEPGYYVWTESMPGDELTNPVTTPCGIVEETTVVEQPRTNVPRAPTVRTVASSSRILVGDPVYDTVIVGGLGAGQEVTVAWTLLGPIAPRNGSCKGLDWSRAPVRARGSFVADHNGSYDTAPVRPKAPGCLTFTESIAATASTKAVSTPPGEASETVLVTRPPVPLVPEVPSGPVRRAR